MIRSVALFVGSAGSRLTAAAGRDPRAALRFLTRLGPLRDAPDPLRLGESFATHRQAESRIRIIRHYLEHSIAGKQAKNG